MTQVTTAGTEQEGRAGPLLSWTIHLARDNPRKTALAACGILAASVAVGLAWGSTTAGAVAFALLLLSTSEYFFPLRFTITAQGVALRGLTAYRRIAWAQVKTVIADAAGVKLSPLARVSRLEPFRGVYLRLPPGSDARDCVFRLIEEHLPESAFRGGNP